MNKGENETIIYDIKSNVATITINRPHKQNALRWEEMDSLISYLDKAEKDDKVQVIRIRSTGNRAFVAGLDLNMVYSLTPADIPKLLTYGNKIVWEIVKSKKPVVVQVQGAAVGWGCITSLAADFVIAGDNEKTFFALPEIDLGIYPATGALTLALKNIGLRNAKRMLMIPERIPLKEAKELGIVTRIYPLEELDEKTFDFCLELTGKHEGVLYMTKALLNNLHLGKLEEWFDKEALATNVAHNYEEPKEFDKFIKNIWKEEIKN